MHKILFVDDEKDPKLFGVPEDACIATCSYEASKFWETLNDEDTLEIYMDFDLGTGSFSGESLLKKFFEDGDLRPRITCVHIISLNTVGVKRLAYLCSDYNIKYDRLLPTAVPA